MSFDLQALVGGAAAAGVTTSLTISELREALTKAEKMADVPNMAKATTFAQSGSAISGLTAYDLEAGAKLLYPVLTPLRNMLPRVSGRGGIQANWRAITGVNTQKISSGVSEGNRGGIIAVSQADYLAVYRGLGFESSASFEAQYAGETFDDVRARAAQTGLHAIMLDEEKVLLGGNGSLALGTTGTPSLTGATAAPGTLTTNTYSVICVALTQEGFGLASVAGGVVQQYVRTNADGSTDTINGGTAQKSAAQTVGVTGPAKITATVAAVRGAMAYAWYWGLAGAEVLGAITTVPLYVIIANATGTQTAASLTATDYSKNGLLFDGLLTQALTSGSNAYWHDCGGSALTADGNGGVVEINTLLQDRWDNYRLNPDTMWVSSQEAANITDKVLSGKANGMMRLNVDMRQGMVAGGTLATSYLNKFGLNGATEVKIRQHPNITPGTILFTTAAVPYPLADIGNVMQVKCRQDYYQIEWPLRSRKYEYGVYTDQVLQHFFPPSMSVLTGIGNG